jgi:hypothetical protein
VIDAALIVGQFDAIDNDPSFLVLFEMIDAADHGRLS